MTPLVEDAYGLSKQVDETTATMRPLPGRTAPVDTTAARRLLGFTTEHLLDGPSESGSDFDAQERRTHPFIG
ncbi:MULTISPECIES: hypothetical protein [unclassified Streptomyces]|uniref:hypothetical protein n=1 Tax=unclassified Streptomyces TaxID=2593676 RepID=UPI0035D98569